MASFSHSSLPLFLFLFLFPVLFALSSTSHASFPPLILDYYASSCPTALEIVRNGMECAVLSDPRKAALVIQLHFHDCFVQGCDGSVLLDDTLSIRSEKSALTNTQSLGGFRIIDRIKNVLESDCPGIVSCADILTIAARDATILVGGPYWDVPLGRKDSKTASYELASTNLPTADENLGSIISKFLPQDLSITDLVALAGAHTVGMAQCKNFRSRIYGDFEATAGNGPIAEVHLSNLRSVCPPLEGSGDENVAPMDYVTPYLFDNSFYHLLLRGEGLLGSDQEMYSSILAAQTKEVVKRYAADPITFFQQFSDSMVKMGNITNPESFVDGEVRKNCRFINT